MDEQTINAAFAERKTRVEGVFNDTEALKTQAQALKESEFRHIEAGLEGTNDRTRTAELARLTLSEREIVIAAEERLRKSKHELELADLEVERVKLIVKLLAAPQ